MKQKSLVINFRKFSYRVKFSRLSSFSEIPENDVPFVSGNFLIFKPEFVLKSSCFVIEDAVTTGFSALNSKVTEA